MPAAPIKPTPVGPSHIYEHGAAGQQSGFAYGRNGVMEPRLVRTTPYSQSPNATVHCKSQSRSGASF